MSEIYLGVDLGGSNLTAAAVTSAGKLLRLKKTTTDSHTGVENTIGKIIGLVRELQSGAGGAKARIRAIGFGVPGVIDCSRGLVKYSPNLPGWKNIPLAQKLRTALKTDIRIDNDANVAALGEQWLGAGKKHGHVVVYTLGTGVGGGIILDNRLVHGACDGAGELGHMTILPDGPRCGCGNRGCLEALASGTAIAREGRLWIKKRPGSKLARLCGGDPRSVTAKKVFEAARSGDPGARDIIRRTGVYLGIAVANVINLLNPELVIIGGGVSQAGEELLRHVRLESQRRVLNDLGRCARIVSAKLGDRAGVFGAARLAMMPKK
ncbi:MAG: ROK family protein [candidate division FCPU426 bacterium]